MLLSASRPPLRPSLRPRASLLALPVAVVLALVVALAAPPVLATTPAWREAVAGALAAEGEGALAAFYAGRGYAPLWTGAGDGDRRAALLLALDGAPAHGLPAARYDVEGLRAGFRSAASERARGLLEVAMSRAFLAFARDVSSGALEPAAIDPALVRAPVRPDPAALLAGIAGAAEPRAFLRALAPQTAEYSALMAARFALARAVAEGGWGPAVPERAALKPGDGGPAVILLRDRLMAMGWLGRTAAAGYDGALEEAVRAFQTAHGLAPDGVAGPATLAAINAGPEVRLQAVTVALERARWLNFDHGARHIWVNLADFTTKIIDDGRVSFATRSVIGQADAARQTPEFSDNMSYMVLNPSWTVPRSIIARDYLPQLQRNPNAVAHLQVVDSRGREVSRSAIDFAAYSARTFPFNLRQAPGPSNALGEVKFMFPNRHAIYLHDTPQRALFARDLRAFSNGCIRLNDPREFAYALLARQSDDPRATYQRVLGTGSESRLNLEVPVPIHIVYATAFLGPRGTIQFRRDVYGRDAKIFAALVRAGVALAPEAG